MTQEPNQNSKIVSARVVPWDIDAWGVALVFADGRHFAYPARSYEQAQRLVENIKRGPASAVLS
jgi:hypothetical protein